jgi:hypothetical protein
MGNRALTKFEYRLSRWMLEHGDSGAQAFLPQLDIAEVTPWRCGCGCASINFQVKGYPEAPPGVHSLAHFLFGAEETLSGIFIYESTGILSALEVYGLPGPAPNWLPEPHMLRTLE